MVVIYHMGAENQGKVVWNSSQCSYPTSHPSSLPFILNSFLLLEQLPYLLPPTQFSSTAFHIFCGRAHMYCNSLCFCFQMSTQTRECVFYIFYLVFLRSLGPSSCGPAAQSLPAFVSMLCVPGVSSVYLHDFMMGACACR